MRISRTIKLMSLSLVLLIVAAACGAGIESTSDRLSSRVDSTMDRLSGATDTASLYATETVTLSQLNAAGIPIGSHDIGCDDPLDIVIVEGMFDRENLFSTGVAMAGGTFEAMAMDMVAEIYDPETDMPLGMIGDETGGSLTGITQSNDGSIATGSVDGGLMLTSSDSGDDGNGKLIPEATCQEG